uniref:Uncharacterized protein n=1 Tax=Anguilla anguilla TaxID=7936 RepID=A0A0E9P8I2_ANGAN
MTSMRNVFVIGVTAGELLMCFLGTKSHINQTRQGCTFFHEEQREMSAL